MLNNVETMSKALGGAVSVQCCPFNFMFDRFLVAIGVVSADVILDRPIYVARKSDFLPFPARNDRDGAGQ